MTDYVTACMCHSDVCVRACQNEINFGLFALGVKMKSN